MWASKTLSSFLAIILINAHLQDGCKLSWFLHEVLAVCFLKVQKRVESFFSKSIGEENLIYRRKGERWTQHKQCHRDACRLRNCPHQSGKLLLTRKIFWPPVMVIYAYFTDSREQNPCGQDRTQICFVKTNLAANGKGLEIKSIGGERGEVVPIFHQLPLPTAVYSGWDRHTHTHTVTNRGSCQHTWRWCPQTLPKSIIKRFNLMYCYLCRNTSNEIEHPTEAL